MNEEEWRNQRAEAMQEKLQQKEEAENRARIEQQLEMVLSQILTPEAKTRLVNVRLVNYEKYLHISQTLVMLVQQGKVRGKINEDQLKQLLLQSNPRKEMKITRK